MGLRVPGPDGNWAQEYDEVVERHGPLLAMAVGRCLTGIWTPRKGLLTRRSAIAWASREPVVFDFEGLLLEFEFKGLARSVTTAKTNTPTMTVDPEGWYRLDDDPEAPASLSALIGQRLWAVDAFEMPVDECDLGFAFSSGYLAMTSSCCCIVMLSCGAPSRRQLRLASASPTRAGYPPKGVVAPRQLTTWGPEFGTDPAMVSTGREDNRP